MSKAENFISDCTRNCSNEIQSPYPQIVENIRKIGGELEKEYHPWLSPDQARRAVEIAREEMIELAGEYLDGLIEKERIINGLKQAMKDE